MKKTKKMHNHHYNKVLKIQIYMLIYQNKLKHRIPKDNNKQKIIKSKEYQF